MDEKILLLEWKCLSWKWLLGILIADSFLEEAKSVGHIGFGSIERSEWSTNEKKAILSIAEAVDRDEAHRLTEENKNKKAKRGSKKFIGKKKNPDLFISKTRLSMKNLPLSIDEKKIKNLGK
ncbi:hypothetical protein F8M41_002149 [Gigaspora margarita]|uniref:Uncharacterized protein n=1 Tax=Gigaspora margarita TaxID=4874 RepID=A0A8H4A8Q0_GIGMA|nr:hypothetical protein F8M41_002149 [Gigaspora margarita]